LKGGCDKFVIKLDKLLKRNKSPGLSINSKKTIFSSRGSKRLITGLYICPNGDISIGRKNKRYIKKLIYDFKNNNILNEELTYLKGYISYILDVEPDFYNRLALKYSTELLEKIRIN
jgi:hypothetical protein